MVAALGKGTEECTYCIVQKGKKIWTSLHTQCVCTSTFKSYTPSLSPIHVLKVGREWSWLYNKEAGSPGAAKHGYAQIEADAPTAFQAGVPRTSVVGL